MSKRAPKSPYQKYNKTPFVYSETYQHWRKEVKENGACGSLARKLACTHAKQNSVWRRDCDGKANPAN